MLISLSRREIFSRRHFVVRTQNLQCPMTSAARIQSEWNVETSRQDHAASSASNCLDVSWQTHQRRWKEPNQARDGPDRADSWTDREPANTASEPINTKNNTQHSTLTSTAYRKILSISFWWRETTIGLPIITLKTDNRFQKSKTDYWIFKTQLYVFVHDCSFCDE